VAKKFLLLAIDVGNRFEIGNAVLRHPAQYLLFVH
jgi:hypothetical protein